MKQVLGGLRLGRRQSQVKTKEKDNFFCINILSPGGQEKEVGS